VYGAGSPGASLLSLDLLLLMPFFTQFYAGT
jgi:hypothetical protein